MRNIALVVIGGCIGAITMTHIDSAQDAAVQQRLQDALVTVVCGQNLTDCNMSYGFENEQGSHFVTTDIVVIVERGGKK